MLKLYLDADSGKVRKEYSEDGDNSVRIYIPRRKAISLSDYEEVFRTSDIEVIKGIMKGLGAVEMAYMYAYNLKPCPRCGAPAVMHRFDKIRGNCYISCTGCGLEGPKHFLLETHARDDWNYRPLVADHDPDYNPYRMGSRLKRVFRVDDMTRIEGGGNDSEEDGSESKNK